MLIGYARVSKSDGSQLLDLQLDALIGAGIAADRIYEDRVSSRKDHRPGLEACLKALQRGNNLIIWKLDSGWISGTWWRWWTICAAAKWG